MSKEGIVWLLTSVRWLKGRSGGMGVIQRERVIQGGGVIQGSAPSPPTPPLFMIIIMLKIRLLFMFMASKGILTKSIFWKQRRGHTPHCGHVVGISYFDPLFQNCWIS